MDNVALMKRVLNEGITTLLKTEGIPMDIVSKAALTDLLEDIWYAYKGYTKNLQDDVVHDWAFGVATDIEDMVQGSLMA